jgi:Arc/MetJ-type ribon-helix-helix transcriptional regulator
VGACPLNLPVTSRIRFSIKNDDAIAIISLSEACMSDVNVRTTITVPRELLAEADRSVESGRARSRNELIIQGLRRELAAQRRAEIDAQINAAYAQLGPEELEEELRWADDGLDDWERETRRIESGT